MRYAKIKPVDVANGEGCRVSVFFSGCPHHCPGCFNPELWDYEAGEVFDIRVINRILNLCEPDYISGLSLLGGEPICPDNIVGVTHLCREFKRRYPNKTIWCYTGYLWDVVCDLRIMRYIDVLVDGQFKDSLKDPRLKFRGSSNQRIIDIQQSDPNMNPILRKDLMV